MTIHILLIAGAYVLLAVLLVVTILSTAVPNFVRVGATLLAIGGMFGTYVSVGELRGWPSDTLMPPSFQLLWARVVDPDPITKDRGHVFLWVEALDDDNYPSGMPRAYQLPYTTELAALVDVAVEQLQAGDTVGGRLNQTRTEKDTAERLSNQIVMEASSRPAKEALGERYVPFDFGNLQFTALPRPVTPDKPQ